MTAIPSDDRVFLGHPRGLAYLAFTEAWERFSFYGMQTLLVLFMMHQLLLPGHRENVLFLSQAQAIFGGVEGQILASRIFGAYAACVYLTPILGGFIADRWLGKRRTVLLGAVTMAAGHFLMAFEATFFFALLFLVIGSGLFKGNIASQVGSLYKPDDLRRADAFQIFYLAINAGVIASPLIVGTLGETVGWHWGFGAAGIGMLVGLVIYVSGQKYLPADHFSRPARTARAPMSPMDRSDWLRTAALLLLIPVLGISIIPNNQIFNAYMVWADSQFDLVFLGRRMPTTWLVTLDAVVSVSFLAGVALFYRWWKTRWQEPDELQKMVIGSVFSIAGMLVLWAAAATQGDGKIGLGFAVLFHVLNSIGFAHVLPVSLALFARLAPAPIEGTVIGLYYLAMFMGNAVVGHVGGWLTTMPTTEFWLVHAGFALGSGIIFAVYRLLLWPHLTGGPNAGNRALS